jgi:engulfment/cell motility protein 1
MQSEFNLSNRDIVSVAVEIASEKHLRKLNQNEPLSEIIHSVCTEFNVSKHSGMYALQLMDEGDAGGNKYLTEENRGEIKNGSILRLVLSPSEMVRQIIVRLRPEAPDEEVEGKEWALQKVSKLSADPVFAKAFHANGGYSMIMEIILNSSELNNNVTCCLKSFIWLMHHHLVSPTSNQFIRRLIDFVSSEQHLPVELVKCCLVILTKAVQQKECAMMTGIGIPDLIEHLCNRENPVIQEKALALINALAQGPHSITVLGSVVSKQIRDTIQKNILCNDVTPSMAHELYVYQTLILGLLVDNLTHTVDPSGSDSKYITELNEILASANDDMQNMKGSIASLIEDSNPVTVVDKDVPAIMISKPFVSEDFVCSTPRLMKAVKNIPYTRSKSIPTPSSDTKEFPIRHSVIDFSSDSSVRICRLTLYCMLHFARRYRRTFVRVLLEEEALSRPFPWTCECLVRLICELLGVGILPKHGGILYQPMVFSASDGCSFIEELFCHVALQLGRTRRQMRARTPSDQEKVILCFSMCFGTYQ